MQTGESDSIAPALTDAEHTADSALAKACAAPRPGRANTGELIQIEELLATAADAVKRAISLRRRRRADEAAREAVKASMADVEAEASADGTHRIFRDARGVRWDVFAVHPAARLSVQWQLAASYATGWLCFDSGGQKRRLGPIPANWERLTNRELEQLGDRAEGVATGEGRAQGTPGSDSRKSSS